MTLPLSPRSHIPYHACYLGLDADHELSQLFSSLSHAKDDWSLCEYHLLAGGSGEQINKVTISTQLTQAEKPREIPVPHFCTDFTDVFSEKTYNILPPHQPFDHTIELKDSFVSKIVKVYPLNPAEQEVMQLAIDEDRRAQKPGEGLEMKAEAGGAQRGSDDWARRYHQWWSRINQGSTQVNSTGVYWAMYWTICTVTGTRTDQAMLPLLSYSERGAG